MVSIVGCYSINKLKDAIKPSSRSGSKGDDRRPLGALRMRTHDGCVFEMMPRWHWSINARSRMWQAYGMQYVCVGHPSLLYAIAGGAARMRRAPVRDRAQVYATSSAHWIG